MVRQYKRGCLGWDGSTSSGTLRYAVMMQSLSQVGKYSMSFKVFQTEACDLMVSLTAIEQCSIGSLC